MVAVSGLIVIEARAAGVTVTVWLPVTELVPSVAVSVREPAVLSVTAKLPTPFERVLLAPRTAAPSVLVRWTVPA